MEQYIVSARKYRPATFDMVVGQRALTTTLLNAIRTGKLAHAYLFCGPRGVGKTTCARIFAKTINCLNPGENGEPCGVCESCRAFDEQRSMNIHELDAASNNSVDDIRELIDQVRIPPQTGKYKVFIIDEVHMLSQQAFNAFLKTLEEPPKYVIFILATTEKHKILPTILSRCQVYDFARITVQNTVEHLKYVAEKEGYKAEDDALSLIAQKADGGMRDALSIFDQMVSFTGGNITYQSTLDNLNILDSEYYFRVVDNMLKGDVEASLILFNEVTERGFDGGNFISGLASHLRNLLVSRDAKTLPLLEVGETFRQRYQEQAMRCKPQFLYRAIKLCNDCDLGYRQSRNKRLQVELCLIQATQSVGDEDGVGAGLCPAKILKPLFQQPTAQGAEEAAKPQVKEKKEVSEAPQSAPAAPATPKPTASRPSLRTLNLNTTSIRKAVSTPSTTSAQKTTQAEEPDTDTQSTHNGTLNKENLILAWQQYANSLPQSEKATAQRMRGITPEVVSANTFHIIANNPLIEKSLQKMRKGIERHICTQLNLAEVTMQIEVAKVEEAIKSVSKPDQFRKMLNDSPSLALLNQEFKLKLE
ncbi:MAG: DNA polymerase III subunit gamma/tau [Bacteroidaceae bacterium]|nr:DNA polymerase III subunit gamma/tau [Bacteroidaceae bacterium]